MQILIENISIFTGERIIKKGNIAIAQGKIIYCGEGQYENSKGTDLTIRGDNLLAMPGLINCHTHAAMTYTRGYADDTALFDWLNHHIWPLEDKLTAEDVYWGTLLAISEMIQSGTTCFADMYFFMEEVARAVEESGMRAALSYGLTGINPKASENLTKATEFALEWRSRGEGRITTMLGPHAPYTCPPSFMEKVLFNAKENNLPIHIHLAETKDELKTIREEYNKSPIEWAESLNIFQHKTLAAHCVHLTENDLDILKTYDVGVAYNPHSNMKLASGIAPIYKMLKRGIKVGLGTDGAGSNNVLDMFAEMKTGALLQKVQSLDPEVLPAQTSLEMATKNGAYLLGLEGELGLLKEGFKADLILLDIDNAHWVPQSNLIAHLVYCAKSSDVKTVFIDGQIVYNEGEFKTIDMERVKWEVNSRLTRLTT